MEDICLNITWTIGRFIVLSFFPLLDFFFFFRFFVDDVPIRRYPRKSDATFPLRPMWVYGSIWDASSWATEDGKYKADYRYQPFVARYTNFKASGCSAFAPARCHPVSASPFRSGLTGQQYWAMKWVQSHHLVYDYCRDFKRDHSLTPECWG
jgi:xyloglucan:xyloglucosyl transferase